MISNLQEEIAKGEDKDEDNSDEIIKSAGDTNDNKSAV